MDPYPLRELTEIHDLTHIDLSLASAHWEVPRRAAPLRLRRFQRVTPYKTVTGVTARYQQVMPRKEEDTPSSSISSSVSPSGTTDRDDGDLVPFSRAYRLSCTPQILLTTPGSVNKGRKDKRARIGNPLWRASMEYRREIE